MKKISSKKGCFVIAAILSFFGIVSLVVAVILAIVGFEIFVQLFDEVTSSVNDQPTGVGFFESTGGWDYRRIALIEPYQAMSTDSKTWMMDLQTNSIRHQASISPTKLDVMNNKFIVTYAPNALFRGERFSEVWFIIIPEENIEKGFTTEEEFLAYLEDKNIDQPNLTDVNELYKELVNKGYLKWYPKEYR